MMGGESPQHFTGPSPAMKRSQTINNSYRGFQGFALCTDSRRLVSAIS